MKVYAVVFGNYEPSETDSIWTTEALAEARVEQMDGYDWRVVPVEVRER